MIRSKLFVCSLLTTFLFAFTGCGQANIEDITATADAFLLALADADTEAASDYCTNTLVEDIGLASLDPAYNENDFYTGFGISKDVLGLEAQASVTEFCEYYADNLVQNYSITEVTQDGDVGTVQATITTYDDETLNALSPDNEFTTQLTEIMNEYQTANQDELASVYLNEGEDAMMIKLYTDIMPSIMNLMKQNFDSASPEELQITLTVENINDVWLVTDAVIAK